MPDAKKKTYRRRSRRSRRRPRRFVAPKAPLPNKLLVTMKYVDNRSINPGIGALGYHVYSCNGLFDPDVTGGGHQPRGFDQLMTMYDHYTVIGAKITVHFTSQITSVTRQNALCGVAIKDDSTPPPDTLWYAEGRNVSYKQFAAAGGAGNGYCRVNKTYSTKKFLGISHPLASENARGTVAANPTEQAYFHVWVLANDSALDLGLINIALQITYTAVLTEPKQPAIS